MKFAVVALIGSASAIGERWRWETLPAIMKAEGRVMGDLADMEDDFEDAMEKLGEKLDGKFDKYIPELEAWGNSPINKIKAWHDKRVKESDLGQEFARSIEQVGEDFMTAEWFDGFTNKGYERSIKNEDAALLFEDVYAIKEAFKALVESKMAFVNGKLGEASLKNPHFRKIVEMFMEDMGVENGDQLEAKLSKIGMKIAEKMGKCKKLQRLFKDIGRLIQVVERNKEVFDLPQKADFEAWVKKNNFQPWM